MKADRKLPRDFYARDTEQVARDLLGMHLVHRSEGVERRAHRDRVCRQLGRCTAALLHCRKSLRFAEIAALAVAAPARDVPVRTAHPTTVIEEDA